MNYSDIKTAKTSELVAYYNEKSGRPAVKKFADRKTAERRVHDLIQDDGLKAQYGTANCPHCGVHLSNGVLRDGDEGANGGPSVKLGHEFYCMGCGEEFGPEIKRSNKTPEVAGPRPAMATSLKLERKITCVETGEVFKNAFQMWKANPSWMTSAQVDRLTSQLYKAAKAGEKVTVEVGERHFHLLSVQKLAD